MKIPLGFELGRSCYLKINVGTQSNPNYQTFHFLHYGSKVEAKEVGHYFENVNNDNVKIIDKYHLEFDLKLVDKNFYNDTQSQDYLTEFLRYYYDYNATVANHDEDCHFQLFYFYPPGPWSEIHKAIYQTVITTEPPKVKDIIDDDKTIGQYLEIKAITKTALTKEENLQFWSLYRETTGSQEWGSSIFRVTGWKKIEVGQVSVG